MRFLLQPLGTSCTGKTTFTASIGLSYGVKFIRGSLYHSTVDDTCLIIGPYKYGLGRYKGGLDALRSNQERLDVIKKGIDKGYKLTIFEAYLCNYRSHMNDVVEMLGDGIDDFKYILIHLEVPLDIIKQRLLVRSGGIEWSKKREINVGGKLKEAERSVSTFKDDKNFIVAQFPFVTEDDHIMIHKFIEEVTGLQMRRYIFRPYVKKLVELGALAKGD